MPVLGNLFGNIRRCAIGLGVEARPEDIQRYRKDPRGGPGGLGGASVDAFSMTDEERALWILLQKRFHEMEERASRGELLTETVKDGPCKEVIITKDVHEPMPYIDVTAVTHRKDAIYYHLLSGRSRDHVVGSWFVGLGCADTFLARVREYFPMVKDAAMFPGSHNIHLVVSLEQRFDGEDKQLLLYLMGTTVYKYITILEEDQEGL